MLQNQHTEKDTQLRKCFKPFFRRLQAVNALPSGTRKAPLPAVSAQATALSVDPVESKTLGRSRCREVA